MERVVGEKRRVDVERFPTSSRTSISKTSLPLVTSSSLLLPPYCTILSHSIPEPAMSLTLKHLHLNPTPVSSIVSPEDEQYRESLLEEALSLLDSELWTDRKEHHGGLVETFGFPVQQIKYEIDGSVSRSPTGQLFSAFRQFPPTKRVLMSSWINRSKRRRRNRLAQTNFEIENERIRKLR